MTGRGSRSWLLNGVGGAPGWLIVATIVALGVVGRFVGPGSEPSQGRPGIRVSGGPTLGNSSEAEPDVLFLGDSYSAGTGASDKSKRWTSLVAQAEGWSETNHAYGGSGYVTRGTGKSTCGENICPTYDEAIEVAAKDDPRPDFVVISGGRNDGDDPRVEQGVPKFFHDLRDAFPDAKIYVTSPIIAGSESTKIVDKLAKLVRRAADDNHCVYLDIGQPLAGHAGWLIADKVHPNDYGHAATARAVESAIRDSGRQRAPGG